MLDLDLINNTITELENGDTTFVSCERLASLYIVRDKMLQTVDTNISESAGDMIECDNDIEIKSPLNNMQSADVGVEKELSDILPQYTMYCNIKRRYQLKEIGKERVLYAMDNLCTDISEFIHRLYSSTDMPEEREYLINMLDTVRESLK